MTALEEIDRLIATRRTELEELEAARSTIARVVGAAEIPLAPPLRPGPRLPGRLPGHHSWNRNSATEAFRRKIAAEVRSRRAERGAIPKIARREGLPVPTVRTWVAKYREPADDAKEDESPASKTKRLALLKSRAKKPRRAKR